MKIKIKNQDFRNNVKLYLFKDSCTNVDRLKIYFFFKVLIV